MVQRLTQEEFIRRAKEVHGDKYGYEGAVFKGTKSPVRLRCPEHGYFEQQARVHLQGGDCRKCGFRKISGSRRKSQDEYVRQAIEKHAGRYDYSEVEYRGRGHKIRIVCDEHGPFLQEPQDHLRGSGCPTCARGARVNKERKARGLQPVRLTQDDFLRKAKRSHGATYNYSKAVYTKHSEPVIVICGLHGEFMQTAGDHMRGRGCPTCARRKAGLRQRKTTDMFIAEATAKHEGRYSYPNCRYVTAKLPVQIECGEHGPFSQVPSEHLKGHGCPVCAVVSKGPGHTLSSWKSAARRSENFVAFTCYLVHLANLETQESFYKVGLTFTTPESRLRKCPYAVRKVICLKSVRDAGRVWRLETGFLRRVKKWAYLPQIEFGGQTECFNPPRGLDLSAMFRDTDAQLQEMK
jgi:Zn finger protein HypA/HybF involved in hydrogenase expression